LDPFTDPYPDLGPDPDPDPALFGSGFKDANKKLVFFLPSFSFFFDLLLNVQ
jgi:hypothetical protein